MTENQQPDARAEQPPSPVGAPPPIARNLRGPGRRRRKAPPPANLADYLKDFSIDVSPAGLIQLFGAERPIQLEIGSGKGLFLFRESLRAPAVSWLGVEWSREFASLAAERLARGKRTNARVINADARALLPRFADQQFAGIHVYFPDPWWKRKHRKRRLVNADFLDQAARLLPTGACLYLATDVEEYFYEMLKNLAAKSALFSRVEDPISSEPTNDFDYLTHFERKYRKAGRPIWRAQFRRT